MRENEVIKTYFGSCKLIGYAFGARQLSRVELNLKVDVNATPDVNITSVMCIYLFELIQKQLLTC